MNIENRLNKLEQTERIQTACCEKPTLKVMPNDENTDNTDNRKCWNCGNILVFSTNSKTEVILPKI